MNLTGFEDEELFRKVDSHEEANSADSEPITVDNNFTIVTAKAVDYFAIDRIFQQLLAES